MNIWIRRCVPALLLLAGATISAVPQGRNSRSGGAASEQEEVTLPNGKSQRDEIAKAEHQANLKDAAELAELADQLKIDLEKNDRFVVSMATIKKTDDIEKLAKRIRGRLRHN